MKRADDRFLKFHARVRSVLQIVRPGSYRDVLREHLVPAVVSGLVLVAGRCLLLDGIGFRVCLFFRLTGRPCPTCGLTRGFISMARGEWLAAVRDSPLAVLLYVLVAAVFLWNAAGMIFGVKICLGPKFALNLKKGLILFAILIVVIAGNWVYRLLMGFD